MSLARHFFRELRPLFRMLEEPLGRSPAFGRLDRLDRSRLDDPFFSSQELLQPAVDVTEEGNKYVIEAELPGVKRENIQVRVGDGGRSLTIEGKVVSRRGEPAQGAADASTSTPTAESTPGTSESVKAVAERPEQTHLSTERLFSSSTSFSRTVFLPRPVDTSAVSAKLSDGVLTVTVPKAEDPASVQIPIN